jgi:hypothetical protein
MAEQQPQQIEYVPVKAEDIIAERRRLYEAFTAAIPWAIGAVALVLFFLWLFWG